MNRAKNYSTLRQSLYLDEWGDDGNKTTREPTNAEILQLLDALHADITGTVGEHLDQVRSDRYWNS